MNITLRILFRPVPDQLPKIYTILGVDYDERVLPSITAEVLKAVVAQFDAGELITQREVRYCLPVLAYGYPQICNCPTAKDLYYLGCGL